MHITLRRAGSEPARRLRTTIAAAGLVLLLCVAGCATPPALGPQRTRVTLVADGKQERMETDATTVRGFLQAAGVILGELDRVSPPEVSALADGATVTVVRVIHTSYVVTQTIPFEKQLVRDASVPSGQNRLLQSGLSGLLEYHYRITLEDGVEAGRVLIQEKMVQQPRPEVRLIGTGVQVQNVPIEGTLAYLSNQDAWILRDSSFQRRRLTYFGDLDGRVFALSPDGQRLLFSRATTETQQLNELWMIRTALPATEAVSLGLEDVLWADWAPNGESMAWSTAEAVEQSPGWRGNNDLWQAPVSNQDVLGTRRRLIEPEAGGGYGWWGTRYAWSPDGTELAFSRPDRAGVVNARDGKSTTLLTFPAFRTFSNWAWHPDLAWTHDSNFLLSVIHPAIGEKPEESPVFNLAAIERTGAFSATLALEVGMWSVPLPSPEGDLILFGRAIVPYQSATSRYTLHLIDRDGSNQRLLYAGESGNGLQLPQWTWSPDGTAVAFIEFGDVYVLERGEPLPVLLTDEGNVSQIRWRDSE
jgi:resuscitation-promoting factor RpfB